MHRCDALFFDPVKTECQHYFCRACIQPCTDCLMCGADIGTLTAEPKLEGLQPCPTSCTSFKVHLFVSPATSSLQKSMGVLSKQLLAELMDLFMDLCGDAPAFEAAVAARTAAESKSGSPLQEKGTSASATGENGNKVQEHPDVQSGNVIISDKQAPATPPVRNDGEDKQSLSCFLVHVSDEWSFTRAITYACSYWPQPCFIC